VSEVELNEVPQTGGYSVTLPTFEGPLDLLLHLCQKHELDILDIPIGFVTEKYLEYLAVMQLINLDIASEYLVMAATLAHIKSKMLLPAPPPGQEDELAAEEEDPREALIRRLLEYQKYKQAGEELAARGVAGQDVFLRGMRIEEAVHTGLPPLAQVPLFSLVEAFQNVLSKSSVKLSHDVVHERVTLADRINELVDILRVRRRVTFEELFEGLDTKFDLVITFLALLEMTRLRMTRLFQESFDSQIWIEFTAQVTADEDADPAAAGASSEEAHGGANGAGARIAFDTDAPSVVADALDADERTREVRSMFATSDGDEELATSLDTEAPPALDLDAPPADDEAAMRPLQTIPSPPLEGGSVAAGAAPADAHAEEASAASPDVSDAPAGPTGIEPPDEDGWDDPALDEAESSLTADAHAAEELDDASRSTLLDVIARGEDAPSSSGEAGAPADDDAGAEDASGTSAVFDVGSTEEAESSRESTTQDEGARGEHERPSGDEDT